MTMLKKRTLDMKASSELVVCTKHVCGSVHVCGLVRKYECEQVGIMHTSRKEECEQVGILDLDFLGESAHLAFYIYRRRCSILPSE